MKKKLGSNTVKLQDIAKEANITAASVSRALRNKPDISEVTKIRVRKIADKLGYNTNAIASSLRTGKSGIIGVLVPDNTNPYYAALIKDIVVIAKKNNYLVFVINTEENVENEVEAISALISFRVEGIIAVAVDLKNYGNLPVPVVMAVRHYGEKELDSFNYMVVNNEKGMMLSVPYLLGNHRNIYFINGPKGYAPAKIRLRAFKRAIRQEGVEFRPDMVIYGDNSVTGGYDSFMKLIGYAKPPFSLQCLDDNIALGVIKAINEKGLRIPGEVSLVGHDDIEYCDCLQVPLSSIRMGQHIGTQVSAFLFEQLAGNRKTMKTVVDPELIIRST